LTLSASTTLFRSGDRDVRLQHHADDHPDHQADDRDHESSFCRVPGSPGSWGTVVGPGTSSRSDGGAVASRKAVAGRAGTSSSCSASHEEGIPYLEEISRRCSPASESWTPSCSCAASPRAVTT